MNPRVGAIPTSLIRAVNALKRPGDIDLGMGEPTLRPDPRPFEAALAWVRENGCPYAPNAGFPELRELLATYLSLPGGGAEGICVTVGSEEALYLAIKTVVDPSRHEVLVVEPCYLAYPKICELEGIPNRAVALRPEEGFRPRAGPVLESLRPETRLVVINSPANPTGRVWPAEELQALAKGLAGREEPVFVLSDEVYRELYYGPSPPRSIAEWHPHSLVAGSLSKSSALTGLRLGWLAGPPEVVRSAEKVHQFVNTAVDTFAQRVAVELLREPTRLGEQRPLYAAAREALLTVAVREGVELLPPEGAFYSMVRLPPSLAANSLVAAERLLEERRVVTIPGRAFGESAEGWLRLSWVAPREGLEEGMARIADFFGGSAQR